MTALAADTPATYEQKPGEITEKLTIDQDLTAGTVLYAGAFCQIDDGYAQQVKDIVAAATQGFAGVLVQGGAAGTVVDVRRVCWLVTAINVLVAIDDEGAAVYAVTNNPADVNKSSTANMPIGKIARVITAGSAGSNSVVLFLEADGYSSR